MKELFKSDYFSKSSPTYSKVEDKDYHIIKEIFKNYYTEYFDNFTEINKIDSLDGNSKNYLILLSNTKSIIFKNISNIKDIDLLKNKIEVSNKIFNTTSLLPKFLLNDLGEYFSKDNNNFWLASEFFDGRSFNGSMKHTDYTCKALSRLLFNLKNHEKINTDIELDTHSTFINVNTILSSFYNNKLDFKSSFPLDIFNLLLENKNFILNTLSKIDLSFISRDDFQLTHIDLHPHNVLISKSNDVCFIDIDSLMLGSLKKSIGFMIYKMGRQFYIYNAKKNNICRLFLQKLNLKDEDSIVSDLRSATCLEILRRISIIIECNMLKQDTRWNSMLGIQINALHEIPFIFN